MLAQGLIDRKPPTGVPQPTEMYEKAQVAYKEAIENAGGIAYSKKRLDYLVHISNSSGETLKKPRKKCLVCIHYNSLPVKFHLHHIEPKEKHNQQIQLHSSHCFYDYELNL